MLSRKDFLALVLPPLAEGESYCTVGIKEDGENKDVRQRFVSSIDEISLHADEFVTTKYNAFYGMAKYGEEKRRTTSNAIALKSFYIDLDCGPGKPFQDLGEGILALRSFCKITGLPKPTVVKSGMGAHVYWICKEALPRDRWTMYAERLKELCVQHKFEVDPVVTGEAARILRIPETYHVKDPTNPILVEVLQVGAELSLEEVHKLLQPSLDILNNQKPVKRQLDPVTLALMGNSQSRFKTILLKSLEGTGCAQIAHIYKEQASLEEPMWRAGLSIAQVCVDRDKAIHILSRQHPEYSPEATEKKANETKGPYTCETFKKINPSLCEGCPHKFTSPVQLSKEIVEATEEDNTVVSVEETTQEERVYTIPKYPFPFFRGRSGGVYRKTKTDEEGGEFDELIYPYDLYVVKRIVDPDLGDSLFLRFHTPKDGVREIIIPNTAIVSREKFMATVAFNGIIVLGKKQVALMDYIEAWNNQLMSEKAEKAHRQFGWTDDNSSMIIGDKEITATEIVYSPPSSPTLPNIPFFQAKGDFHTWKEIINHYANPGMEYRAFAFFLGFGAPLMRFTALDGFLVNLYNRNSGSGKTTILHAINSIYGRPKELTLRPKDTYNVRMNRLGVMQSLAVTMDEITNMDAEQMSQQVYDVTSGRAKHRLMQHENRERHNSTNFQTGMISSSNRSVMDVLMGFKGFPDGELKRILEIDVVPEPNADATWSRAHFERLKDHYGHAIYPYGQCLISQLASAQQILEKTRDKVDQHASIRPSERYWSLIVALATTGGLISKQLGLHDIPVQPVFNYGVNLIKETRRRTGEYLFNADEFLGAFMRNHYNEILVINASADKRTGLEQGPIREPRGILSARYEPDTKILYVSTAAYRAECDKLALNFEETLKPYIKAKALIMHSGNQTAKPKRMFVGTSAGNSSAVRCLWFDTTKLDFFNENVLIRYASDDEDTQPTSSGTVE